MTIASRAPILAQSCEGSAVITSRHNPKIKQIRALRMRKERERTGRFFVTGAHLVSEALHAGADVEAFVVAPELVEGEFAQRTFLEQCRGRAPCLTVTAEVFFTMTDRERCGGLGAVVNQRWSGLSGFAPAKRSCWVALDSVQYPGNLGSILRVCDAVEASGVILLGNATDPFDPLAVRASTGAIFTQQVVRTTYEEFLAWKRRFGCNLVGASPEAVLDYRAVAYRSPLIVTMGSESRGLSESLRSACNLMVRIPMAGRCDSLNLAMATALLMYEIFGQRQGRRSNAVVQCAQP